MIHFIISLHDSSYIIIEVAKVTYVVHRVQPFYWLKKQTGNRAVRNSDYHDAALHA